MRCGTSISVDGYESYYPIGPFVECREYQIIKETPKGFWVALGFRFEGFAKDPSPEKRWIGNDHHKKFACRTRQEALQSFKARKKRQIRLLENQLHRAKRALEEAGNIAPDGQIIDRSKPNPETDAIL